MFQSISKSSPVPKCVFTHGTLPRTINTERLPGLKKPFSTIRAHHWCHTVDLILPEELYNLIQEHLSQNIEALQYSRVYLPISALIENDFFNVYIKTGNIEMLSEGRPWTDPLYSLREGVLRLELPKHLYERAGLAGKPIPDGGRKHLKKRFCVELNLRLPSMLSGKKGFERIRWASKNVLTDTVTWLFRHCNASSSEHPSPAPIEAHHPIPVTPEPTITTSESILVPSLRPPSASLSEWTQLEDSLDILEWLGMVALQSPRVAEADGIDPFLARYAIPGGIDDAQVRHVVRVRWRGFIGVEWMEKIWGGIWSALNERDDAWFALTAVKLQTEAVETHDGYTVLMPPISASERKESMDQRSELQVDEDRSEDLIESHLSGSQEESASASLEVPQDQREFLLWEMVNGVDPR